MKMNFYKTYLAMLALAASIMLPSSAFAQAPASPLIDAVVGEGSSSGNLVCDNLPAEPAEIRVNAGSDCVYNVVEKAALSDDARAVLEAHIRFFPDKYDSGPTGAGGDANAATTVPTYKDTVSAVWGDLDHSEEEVTIGEFNGSRGFSFDPGASCTLEDFQGLIEKELDGVSDLNPKQMVDEFAAYAKTALMKEAMTMLFSSPAISAVMDGIKATANARMSMMKNSCNAREIMAAARDRVDQRMVAEAIDYCKKHANGDLPASKIPNGVSAPAENEADAKCNEPNVYSKYAENYYYKFSYATDLHSQLCFTGDKAWMINCNRYKAGDAQALTHLEAAEVTKCDTEPTRIDPVKHCSWLAYVSNVKANVSGEGGAVAHGRRFTPKQVTMAGLLGVAKSVGASIAAMLDFTEGEPYKTPEEIWKDNSQQIVDSYENGTKLVLKYGNSEKAVPVKCFCRASKGFEEEIYASLYEKGYSYSSSESECSEYASMISGATTNQTTGLSSMAEDMSREVEKATACIYWNTFTARNIFDMESYLRFNQRKGFYRAMSVLASSEAQQEIYSRLVNKLRLVASKALGASKTSDEHMAPAVLENIQKQMNEYQSFVDSARKSADRGTSYASIGELKAAVAKAVREARKGAQTSTAPNQAVSFVD